MGRNKNKPLDLFSLKNEHKHTTSADDLVQIEVEQGTPKKEKQIKIDTSHDNLDSAYAELIKPKKQPVKMTFDIDRELAKELKKLCNKMPHGFKKLFINNAIEHEVERIKQTQV